MSLSGRSPSVLVSLMGATLLALPCLLLAASTGTASLHMPQGSTAGTAGGDYVSDGDGLNTFYRYFIEVPAGVSRLQIEIFDADLGLGGGTEDTAGRDRDRGGGFTTTTAYSLLNPAAAARTTSFAIGSAAAPAGSDNAWTTFFDSTGDDVRDSFGTLAYTNNDGLVTWGASWAETNDDGNVNNGDIRITGSELRLGDNGSTGAAAARIERQADLSAFTGAILTFDRRTQAVEDGDQYQVEVSSDGGGSWTTLETWTGTLAAGTESYDISAFRALNTRIRFIHVTGYGSNDFLFVDNVRIQDTRITPGHWELRVDMGGGNDVNAIGIRAHDGASGAGGTELNVYFDSHSQLGINPPASGTTTRGYDLFPYVTSGCSAAENDFDYDSNRGNVGSMSFSSRSGSFVHNLASTSLSGDDGWARNSFTGWTSDLDSIDYGIWAAGVSVSSYLTDGTPNGNYATFYMTNQLAAANPPAANPTANAFRVYLPSDAGTAPVKPYVEQLLRYGSGPNPLAVGQSSGFMVTIRVVNPTSRAITFSASNLVTANVPGSGAAYGGAAQVSQGAIAGQPAVGGTGDITWNPGTVAAGGTALLAYEVDITPTLAGQRIAATATPASGNGTRATYVDETGNAIQARATYTFGPLCELAVTEALLTHAVVSSFRTFADERGGVRIEWTTASETGTAGFRVLRRDATGRFRPVHEGLLPGLIHAAQGGTYRFHDESASPLEPQVYLLEEVEAAGRSHTYGPFAALVDWERGPESRTAYEREAHHTLRKAFAPIGSSKGFAKADAGAHLSIRETGLYYMTREQAAIWLGLTVDKAEKAIVKGDLSLTRDGQPAAWWPDMADKKTAIGLFFYGESLPSLYSLDTVYRLQKDRSGPLMQAGTVAPAAASAGGSFSEMKPFETDAFPATAISPDPESDYWFWDFVISGDPDFGKRTFTFDAPALASGSGTLTVRLQGATDNATPGEHHAAIRLNGTLLGETDWQGIAPREATFPIPDGVLLAAGNQLEILGTVGGGAPFSFFYVDGFDAGYPRQFVAEGDALTFTSGQPVTVSGFSSSAVRLLDVTDPLRPRWLTGAAFEAGGLSFVPSPGARYLAAGPGALKTPAVRPWSDPLAVSVDVLIVVPPGLESEAERLATHRRSQGLEAMVVNLDQVADLFGNGIATPHALRAFLAWASPRYAVLVGEGSLDYRNLQGYGDSVMPPLMVNAEGGLFPSDNRLAGPEMAIGRIPVLTAAELATWIDKILAYEGTGEPAWAANAIMLSDSPDGGAIFSDDSNRIAARLPSGISVDHIDLGSEALAKARTRLFQGIEAGASLIDYVGHGGLDRLSAGGLLTSSDVPGLTNGERLPVLTAMTCTVNRFAVPGVPSLGEFLVKSPDGGAAAVWGPSGLASHSESRQLAEAFYRRVDGPGRLGDWILGAMREFEERGGHADLLDIYNLLGDPALIVRRERK